jgi:hypothetical protein
LIGGSELSIHDSPYSSQKGKEATRPPPEQGYYAYTGT